MRTLVLAALLAVPLSALAQEDAPPPPAEEKKEEKKDEPKEETTVKGPFSKGRWLLRGGLHLDVNQTINLGGTNQAGNPTVGARGGVGYFPIDNLEADLDLNFYMGLNPVAVQHFEVTPGARYWLFNSLQLRVGVPIPIYPKFGLGVLGGVAYRQPLGGHAALVVGVDYTYWLTESFRAGSPYGRIDVHGGVQTWF